MLASAEEYAMVRETAAAFFARSYPVSVARKWRDEKSDWQDRKATWHSCAELGIPGMLVSERYEGLGLGCIAAGIVHREMGRNLAIAPFLSTSILATILIEGLGSDEQKGSLLPQIAAGQTLVALAHEEVARHAPSKLDTSARGVGDGGYRLDGRKVLVLDGGDADFFIVSARIERSPNAASVGLFLVAAQTTGVFVREMTLLDGRPASEMIFHDCLVDVGNVLSSNGASALERTLDVGRACLASELVGIALETFDRTIAYLKDRTQFGQPIGAFQALQHRAAHLFCEIEVARAITARACKAIDQNESSAALLVSVAKAKAGDTALLAASEAIQLHGGIGMTDELDIGLFLKRARVSNEIFGDSAYHCDRAARIIEY